MIRMRKDRKGITTVCLYFNSEFTDSNFINDIFVTQSSINRGVYYIKGEGKDLFY